MIRRKRSPFRYLIPALVVGGALWLAQTWLRDRNKRLVPGRIASVSEAVRATYDGLSRDFRAKVPIDEFTAMFHRMADPDHPEALPAIRQASVFDGTGPEHPRARLRVEYPPTEAKAEYHFARVEDEWKLQSFTRAVGEWAPVRVAESPPAEPPAAPSPDPGVSKLAEPPRGAEPPARQPAPKPAATASAPAGRFPRNYVIQPGDTLTTVSRHFYGTGRHWRRILEANPGLRERHLRIGRRILIPSPPEPAPPRRGHTATSAGD